MGHQDYILLVKNEEDKQRIIKVIHDHNHYHDNLEPEQQEDPVFQNKTGEELECCCYTTLLKSKPKKYADYTHAIVCGNGGGRLSTFKWFQDNEVEHEGYHSQKWVSKRVIEDIAIAPTSNYCEEDDEGK